MAEEYSFIKDFITCTNISTRFLLMLDLIICKHIPTISDLISLFVLRAYEKKMDDYSIIMVKAIADR